MGHAGTYYYATWPSKPQDELPDADRCDVCGRMYLWDGNSPYCPECEERRREDAEPQDRDS